MVGCLMVTTLFNDSDLIREIISNAVSLACGFIGNIFLLLNFTGRVRYILALPLSIIFWIASSVIVSQAGTIKSSNFSDIIFCQLS